MKLVAVYALSFRQAIEGAGLPDQMLAELRDHETVGRVVKHVTDDRRQVLRYEVYEREKGDPEDVLVSPGDIQLMAQLQASLLQLGVSTTERDLAEIRALSSGAALDAFAKKTIAPLLSHHLKR